jgi:hypothetical protein
MKDGVFFRIRANDERKPSLNETYWMKKDENFG